jgi:acyl-CoA thioester hydrolase
MSDSSKATPGNTASGKPLSSETSFPVRYAETDAMGVVHHANYLVYFEEGRSHFMRELGSDYADLEAAGFQLPVTEVALRYAGSLRYGQSVRIRTWLEENLSRRLSFAYEVRDASSDVCLVTGSTRHIWTDARGRVTRQPERWKQLFQQS